MRIAHLLFTKRFAGSERYAIELANAQSQSHEVCFVLANAAAEDRPDAWAHRLDPRVEQHRLWYPPLLPAIRVAHWASGWRPDVCHAHLSFACKALAAVRAPTVRVATLHIAYKPRQHRHMDGLIAITPQQVAQIPPSFGGRVVQINNWSQPRPPKPGAREKLRAAWGVAPGDWVVGTLGRSEYSKGWDLLVDAFERAQLPGARLVLVGHGPAWQSVRGRAGARVVMPGFTNEPADCLAAFDLFVSAARSEPFGLVFLEAMHAGLPVLATATDGAVHLQGSFEPLLPCGDVVALADALARLNRQRPGRRNHPVEPFSLPMRVADIEAFYRACGAR